MVVNLVQYVIYLSLITYSSYYMFRLLTTEEERSFYKSKVRKEFTVRKDKLIERELSSSLQEKIEVAGIKHVNAFRYQIVRILLLLYLLYEYVVNTITAGNSIAFPLTIIVGLILLTEPKFKFSLINVFLNIIIKRKQKAKVIELFTLFDMVKSDLHTLNDEQEVNVYNTIKSVLPMFNHIQGTLSKFLSYWKRSPSYARDVFYSEIGGENAKTLSDILYRLDSVSKEEAIKIIESESSVFSKQYSQKELQKGTKKTTAYYGFFLTANILIVIWMIVYVSVMVMEGFSNTGVL